MNALVPFIVATLSTASVALPAATPTVSSPTVTAKVRDAAGAAVDLAAAEKSKFEQEAAEKLKELETKIGSIKEKAKGTSRDEVRKLEAKSKASQRKLRAFKKSTVAAGRELKRGVSEALDDLADACEAAWKRLSS